MSVPERAVRAALDERQTGSLLPAGRSRQVREPRTCDRLAARRGTGSGRRSGSCPTTSGCARSSAWASIGRSRTTISSLGTARPSRSLASPAIRTPTLDAPRSRPYPLPRIPLIISRINASRRPSRSLATASAYSASAQFAAIPESPRLLRQRSCIPICPVQAKYDAMVHVAQAERAGAELIDRAIASLSRLAPTVA